MLLHVGCSVYNDALVNFCYTFIDFNTKNSIFKTISQYRRHGGKWLAQQDGPAGIGTSTSATRNGLGGIDDGWISQYTLHNPSLTN